MDELLSFPAHIEPSDDVIFRDLDGESVLLDMKTGLYFGLNPVGTRVWHLLAEQKSPQQILDILLAEYDVSAEQCRRDLAALLELLKSKGLVRVAGGASGA